MRVQGVWIAFVVDRDTSSDYTCHPQGEWSARRAKITDYKTREIKTLDDEGSLVATSVDEA